MHVHCASSVRQSRTFAGFWIIGVGDVEWPGCGSAESPGLAIVGERVYRGPGTRGILTLVGPLPDAWLCRKR